MRVSNRIASLTEKKIISDPAKSRSEVFMRLLIEHAHLVTMNDKDEVFDDGALVIDGRYLTYVGPSKEIPAGDFDRVIDGRRFIALPGLINSHCHSPANLLRGLLPGSPLEIWRAHRCSVERPKDRDSMS